MRRMLPHALLLVVLSGPATPCFSQTNPNLQTYFKDYIGLSDDQIAAIRGGQAVAKTLHSRTPEEIFVFGAVYVNAAPDSYLKFSRDFERLRKLPAYLALSEISSPPQLSDLEGFTFERGDIKDLKSCKPGDCSGLFVPKDTPGARHLRNRQRRAPWNCLLPFRLRQIN